MAWIEGHYFLSSEPGNIYYNGVLGELEETKEHNN